VGGGVAGLARAAAATRAAAAGVVHGRVASAITARQRTTAVVRRVARIVRATRSGRARGRAAGIAQGNVALSVTLRHIAARAADRAGGELAASPRTTTADRAAAAVGQRTALIRVEGAVTFLTTRASGAAGLRAAHAARGARAVQRGTAPVRQT